MKRIGLFTNLSKDAQGIKTSWIVETANNLDIEVLVAPHICNLINKGIPAEGDEFFLKSDIIISLGGDGTLLQAARQAAKFNKPIIGINMGNLGFLTDTDLTCAEEALLALKENHYYIEKRMMLCGTVVRDKKEHHTFLAFNDIGIMKELVSRIIHLKASINGHEINSYSGDGLLVSSPTGSTAYSLSAGGPIVNPSLECLILTPICPHSLNARSIITNSNDIVEIEVISQNRNITLTADGQAETILSAGDKLFVKKADIYVQLLRTKDQNFFDLVHEKITK
ncbi:MAG: NAD(+)/NADH kinase [Caldicoprobacterales bacterium]|nr:NAD(+)/NADH kinase [Clostridiales bacterium]